LYGGKQIAEVKAEKTVRERERERTKMHLKSKSSRASIPPVTFWPQLRSRCWLMQANENANERIEDLGLSQVFARLGITDLQETTQDGDLKIQEYD